ncbi:hypothetical protein [Streptomyces klenkii]
MPEPPSPTHGTLPAPRSATAAVKAMRGPRIGQCGIVTGYDKTAASY